MTTTRPYTERSISTSDGSIGVTDWSAAGPAILFVHATGFHRRCWDRVIELLPGYRCIAFDILGHGISEKPAPPDPYGWDRLARGLGEVAQKLRLDFRLGVGHSIGGYMVVRMAATSPGLFRELFLVDPSILPVSTYGMERVSDATSFVLKRRNQWASPEEMVERFKDRKPFSGWDPRVLSDYCTYGLMRDPHGEGFVLACPPEVEAAIYAQTATSDPYQDISQINLPVRIVRARQRPETGTFDMSSSPTAPDLATRFARATDECMPEHSHYLPMEAPELVARYVQSAVNRRYERPLRGKTNFLGSLPRDM